MKDIVIIGSGPAGLSAAIYAKRAMMDTLVIEKEAFSGGQIINSECVDNYLGLNGLSGYEIAMKYREHADALNVEFLNGRVNKVKAADNYFVIEMEDGTSVDALKVVIATGAAHKKLGVPGEKELTGAGVSYCATCDGAFFKNREAAVVGGGNVALEDALYLSAICKKVYLIHRREEFRASKEVIEKVKNSENIYILTNCIIEKLNGLDMLESIDIVNTKNNENKNIKLDGIFVAIGMEPETISVRDIVKCDEAGYIVAGEDCRSSLKGVYAVGDVRTKKVRQLVTAVSDGACAIHSVEEDVNEE